MASSPTDGAKAMSMRILIGGDPDVLPDWKKRKMAVTVPLNMPVKAYLERLLCPRLKWETLDNVVFYHASGPNLESISPTDDVFQIKLTPRQLGFDDDSIKWAWMKARTGDEEPLMSVDDLHRDRLTKFYGYYAPDQLSKIPALLSDFKENEELLFLQLTSKYGPEPTKDMLYRRNVGDPRRARLAVAGKKNNDGPLPSGSGGLPAGDVLSADNELIAALMGRGSASLLHRMYYSKWGRWARQRREQRRIVAFMTGNMDAWHRMNYYGKWKRFAEVNKTRRQLSVSTKLAFKQETVMGGFAEENATLKSEQRRLQAQVEVLETNNSRRLEAVFSSSEAAIIQLKLLTNELKDKDRTISKMEQQLLQLGNKMLAAADAKAEAEAKLRELQADYNNTCGALTRRVEELEADNTVLQDRVQSMRPKTPDHVCKHCPHFYQAINDFEVARTRSQTLLQRLDTSESDKRAILNELSDLRAQYEQIKAHMDRQGDPKDKTYARTKSSSPPRRTDAASPASAPAANTYMTAPSGGPRSSGGGGGGGAALSQEPTPMALPAHMDPSGGLRNVSFALPSAPLASGIGGPGSELGNGSFAMFNNNSSFAGASVMSSESYQPPDIQPQSLPPRPPTTLDTSMARFFEAEQNAGFEKCRLSLERQTMPRHTAALFSSTGQPGVTARNGSSKYHVAPADPRRGLADVSRTLSYSAPMPGMPGGPPVTLDGNRKVTPAMMNSALQIPLAQRPLANPLHVNYGTGPSADPAAMRRELFQFGGGSSIAPSRTLH